MGTWTVAHQQLFVDVQLHDMHLEHVGAHVLAEGAENLLDAVRHVRAGIESPVIMLMRTLGTGADGNKPRPSFVCRDKRANEPLWRRFIRVAPTRNDDRVGIE